MNFTFYHLVLFLSTVLTSPHCWSQHAPTVSVPGYEVKHFTDENGLPQNSVRSIVEDSRGNIWLATERGLVRYDGKEFLKFDDFGTSYSDRNIPAFFLNPKAGNSQPVAVTEAKKCIVIDNGKALIDTTIRWKTIFRPVKDSRMLDWLQVEAGMEYNEKMFFNRTSSLEPVYACPAGRYFTYDKTNVGYYANNRLIKAFPFPGRSFYNFFRIDNDLYYLDSNFGLSRFKAAGKDSISRPEILSGAILTNPGYSAKANFEILWNNASGQVFVALKKSIYILQPNKTGGLTSMLVLEGFDPRERAANGIFFDKDAERLFVGTGQEGLYIFTKKRFRTVFANDAGVNEIFYGQTIFDKNSLLTTEGVKFSFDPVNKTVSAGRIGPVAEATDWDQYSILKDRQGNIWTKQGHDLFRFDSTGNNQLSKWYIKSGFTQLYEGLDGRIWIGSGADGLFYIDPRERAATLHSFAKRELINISWIQQNTEENLWIGTGTGLLKIHLPTKKISRVKEMEGIYIRSLYLPADSKEVWITTYANGIFLLNGNRLTSFPMDKQQYLAGAHCIVEDRKGFFWVTTNRGLFQIKKSDLLAYAKQPFEIYYHYYAKGAGFNTNEFNGGCQPCAVRIGDGIVSLPSINGLVWFNPEQTRPEQPNGQIYLDQMAINGRASLVDVNEFSVPSVAVEASLIVTAPYFGDPYNLKMSYRVLRDGTPMSDWKELDENRNISVPFLGGGKYAISIRKLNGFGRGNYGYKHIDIFVEKYWFETWWFRLVAVLAILTLFYFILKMRIRAIKKQNQFLEAKVIERTSDLEQALRVLGNSEKQLEEQLRLHIHMIASISHDIRTPIRHMSYALDHSYALIEKDQKDTAKAFVSQLKQGVERIYSMVDNIVNFIRPEIHGPEIGLEPVKLKEVIDEKVSLFKQIADKGFGAITVDISSEKRITTDAKLLGIIIHNLIDNAIKIQHGNKIRIYTDRINRRLHLIFEDSGPGMPPELARWLNTEGFDGNDNLPPHYEGIGLIMIKQISKILDLDLFVENTPGACIHVIFDEKTKFTA